MSTVGEIMISAGVLIGLAGLAYLLIGAIVRAIRSKKIARPSGSFHRRHEWRKKHL